MWRLEHPSAPQCVGHALPCLLTRRVRVAPRQTVLLYLQDHWAEEHGGCVRMFADGALGGARASAPGPGLTAGRAEALEPLRGDVDAVGDEEALHECVDIAPLGGRLLVFWSDTMVHGVLPSQAQSDKDFRWALTVWVHTEDLSTIAFDADAERRHFSGTHGHRQLAG